MRFVQAKLMEGGVVEVRSSGSYRGVADAMVRLEPGVTYLVSPENPQKLRHRGRLCVFVGLVNQDPYHEDAYRARVRFVDNGRPGRVDIDDLVLPPAVNRETDPSEPHEARLQE